MIEDIIADIKKRFPDATDEQAVSFANALQQLRWMLLKRWIRRPWTRPPGRIGRRK